MKTPDHEPAAYIGIVSSIKERGDLLSFKVAIPEEMRHPEYLFDAEGCFPCVTLKDGSSLDELTVGSIIKIFDDNRGRGSFSQAGARWRFEKIVD